MAAKKGDVVKAGDTVKVEKSGKDNIRKLQDN
jgi:hypothetical protein